MSFQIGKWGFQIKKDWDIHWYEGIPLDVCIHDMCKSQKENKKLKIKRGKENEKNTKIERKKTKRWRT